MPCFNITPLDPHADMPAHRTGSLSHTPAAVISQRLGFDPARHNIEGKTDMEWRFLADGKPCAIWDMKGSSRNGTWSTFGPAEVFTALFGWRAVL